MGPRLSYFNHTVTNVYLETVMAGGCRPAVPSHYRLLVALRCTWYDSRQTQPGHNDMKSGNRLGSG